MTRPARTWLHPALTLGVMVMAADPLAAAERGGGLRQEPLLSPPALKAPAPARPGITGPAGSQRTPESLPLRDPVSIEHRGTRYLVSEGRWYQQRGSRLLPVSPPEGVLVQELPPGHTMQWVGGVPYFHADGLYYVWRERKRSYEILQEPPSGETGQKVEPSAPTTTREPVQTP